MNLVLASRSPQRRAILRQLGIAFSERPTDVAEEDAGDPVAVASENARRKALEAGAHPGELTLGVDTLVALDGRIYGKPPDEAVARETLRVLAGRTHDVVSGIALLHPGGELQAAQATTKVTFRAIDDATIEWYLATGEWQGRAGGYAIQGAGAAIVERIEGDYLNVVGLPVGTLLDLVPGLLLQRNLQ